MDSVNRCEFMEILCESADFVLRNDFKPSNLSPFRYPGGKSRLRKRIISWISSFPSVPKVFIEPFLGGGSVSLAVAELGLAEKVIAAEIDQNVSAVWTVILSERYVDLCERIKDFKMSRETVAAELSLSDDDLVARAFRCIVRNRVQRGGVMAPGAGLLKRGEGDKGISSRWYPETLIKRIGQIYRIADRIEFVSGDGIALLRSYSNEGDCCAFVDPPYVAGGMGAGTRLYEHFDVSPETVFETLNDFSGPALITYHRSRVVRRLADAAGMVCSEITMRTAHDKNRRELFITKNGSSPLSRK